MENLKFVSGDSNTVHSRQW